MTIKTLAQKRCYWASAA